MISDWTVHFASIPDAYKNQPQNLIYDGAPMQIRFDGSTGYFMAGERCMGSALSVVIFDSRWATLEQRGKHDRQSWLDLAVMLDDGIVGLLPLKKDNSAAMHQFLLESRKAGVDPALSRLYLGAESRMLGADEYHALVIKSVSMISPVEYDKIKRFRELGEFSWIVVGEVA